MTTLDEIAARADAATEGPWGAIQSDEEETTTWLESPYGDVLNHDTRGHGHLREDFTWMKRSDAEFIAHAREDVPALVAALKAVEAVHVPWDSEEFYNGLDGESRSTIKYYCGTCVDGDERPYSWPCPTIAALDEALGS